MQGWKMTAARRAVARMVDTLSAGDRFAVLAFDDVVETFQDGLVAGTTGCASARSSTLAASTRARDRDAGPVRQAIALLTDAERERVLVLATDGQVGNEDQILPRSTATACGVHRRHRTPRERRVPPPAGGRRRRGVRVVESEDRLDAVMDRIHRRIGTPVLSGCRVRARRGRAGPVTRCTPARR